MKKDQMQGILFILPNKNKNQEKNVIIRPKGVEEAEELKRKMESLEDVKIKLQKIAEIQKKLKDLLEVLSKRVESSK